MMSLSTLTVLAAIAAPAAPAYDEGDRLMAAERYQEALALWLGLLKENPDDSEALLRAGIAQSMLAQYDAAAESFDHALRLNPRNAPVLYNRALLRLKLGELDAAEKQLHELLGICDWYPNANYHLGLICEKRGDPAAADGYYVKELNVNPSSAMAWKRHMELSPPPPTGPAWAVWLLVAIAICGALVTAWQLRRGHHRDPSNA